jgi:NTE family protein
MCHRLLAPAIEGENHNKDIDFVALGLQMRREAGYAHARQALERKPGESDFDPLGGFVLDEIPSFLAG